MLVNNAGVGLVGPFLEGSIEDWQWLRRVNLDGVMHGCHAFAPAMAARGRGHLVNVGSMAGYISHRDMAAYCTSKADSNSGLPLASWRVWRCQTWSPRWSTKKRDSSASKGLWTAAS